MDLRPITPADVDLLHDIDSTTESGQYLHVDLSGEGLSVGWRLSERPLRERRVEANRLPADLLFTARQIAAGHEEGLGMVAEHEGGLLAAVLAVPRPEPKVVELLDVRVDYDYRRQGMGTAMVYNVLQLARNMDYRGVRAETRTDNVAAAKFLLRHGFKLAGLDTHRHSNHDLVKEQATLLWFAGLD